MRRIAKGIAAFVAGTLLTLMLCGAIYEQLARRRDVRQLPPRVGVAVDVGGGRMSNIYCSGEGAPTVVFESGGRGLGYDWVQVQAEVAKFTRACWYDRAGQGWSDAPPRVETSADMIEDLHRLLQGAHESPPYVLVGASVGGEYAHIYTAAHPDEVAGLVFVDSSNPDQKEPEALRGPANKLPIWQRRSLCAALPWAIRLGVFRVIAQLSRRRPPKPFREEQKRIYAALQMPERGEATEALKECAATDGGRINRDSGTGNPEVDDAARAAGSLGDRPLIVLTAGFEIANPQDEEERQIAAYHKVWVNEVQPALARLSTRGRQVVVAGATHGIEFDNPGVVIGAVREVVEEARASSRQKNAQD